MSIQLSVFIYIISVSLHAFLSYNSSFRVCIIAICMLLHLNQIQHSLNDSEDRYAELRDNDDDDDDVS